MRVYSDNQLKGLSIPELRTKLELVQINADLTNEEKAVNIQKIEVLLNGGQATLRDRAIVQEMMDGQADIDDCEVC